MPLAARNAQEEVDAWSEAIHLKGMQLRDLRGRGHGPPSSAYCPVFIVASIPSQRVTGPWTMFVPGFRRGM
jgi:hypothetical protein